jgi:HlyD family secretion protein
MKGKAIKIVGRIVILLIVISAAAYGVYYYMNVYSKPVDPNLLLTSGVIEATEVKVGTKTGGEITELLVEEGDSVTQGQVIARVESTDLQIQLEGAQAAVERAQALLDDLKRGLRPEEIEQYQKIVELKEANLERSTIDYDRKAKLAQEKAVPVHEADIARTVKEAAQKDLETSQEQVRIAKLGSRKDQIEAARWAQRQAETQVSQIQKKIADTEVISPASGRVSVKNMELGEIARAGATIITLVDLDRPWVRVFVPENKLGRIKLGMKVEILSDTFPDKVYQGVIRNIATDAEFTPKNVQTQEERVKLVYAIKVYVDNPEQELKPGQQVDARIRLNQ